MKFFNFNKIHEAFDFNEVTTSGDVGQSQHEIVDLLIKNSATNIKLVLSKELNTTKIRTFGEKFSETLDTICTGKQVQNPRIGIFQTIFSYIIKNWISVMELSQQNMYMIYELYKNGNLDELNNFNNDYTEEHFNQFKKRLSNEELMNTRNDPNFLGENTVKLFMEYMPFKTYTKIYNLICKHKPLNNLSMSRNIYLCISKDSGLFAICCMGNLLTCSTYLGSGWVMFFGFTGNKIYLESLEKGKVKAIPDTYNDQALGLIKYFKSFKVTIDKDTFTPTVLKDGRLGLVGKAKMTRNPDNGNRWRIDNTPVLKSLNNVINKGNKGFLINARRKAGSYKFYEKILDNIIIDIIPNVIFNYTSYNSVPFIYYSYPDEDSSIPAILIFVYVDNNTSEGLLIYTTYDANAKFNKKGLINE